MVDVTHKRCNYSGCPTRPHFGIQGSTVAQYCAKHKLAGMVDVTHKRCNYSGCPTQPTYGIQGSNDAQYCAKHALDGMVDIKNKHCEYDGCPKQPTFGIQGSKTAQYCAEHALDGMVDIKNKHCEYDGCPIQPTYGIQGSKVRQYCAKHALDGMVNVVDKRCEHPECQTSTYYGIPGHQPTHCAKHRKPGMIRHPNARCKYSKCKSLAIYGTNWTPTHCEEHKTDDDLNLVERPCVSCGLAYILDKTNKCENCNPEAFATARLAKQNALMNYLDLRGLTGDTTDSVIDGGVCGKERPDRVYDFGNRIVILECDEHQHRDRPCLCEQTRMVNIGQSFGGIPVYFIRWNPDDYDADEPDSIAKRHKLCGDLIRDLSKNKHTIVYDTPCSSSSLSLPLVSVLYMFYDGWTSLSTATWSTVSG